MTGSEPTINRRNRHPIIIVFGLAVIGFCLFCCLPIMASSVSPHAGLGTVVFAMVLFFPVFIAFGMARFLFYANANEAWGLFPCILSPIILFLSGITMGLFELIFFPEEVSYRSLQMGQSGVVFFLTFMPMCMVFCIILFCRLPGALLRTTGHFRDQLPKQRTVGQFIQQNGIKDIIVTVLLCLVLSLSAFAWLVFAPPPPATGKHPSYEEFLYNGMFPADGYDFCYCSFSANFYCGFTISEEGFQNWAKAHADWEIRPISLDEPIEFGYYADVYGHRTQITVIDGWFAMWHPDKERPYVVEEAVFDRNTNRVYYQHTY